MRVLSMMSVLLLGASVAAAATTAKDELLAASKKLGASGSYSWVTTVGSEGGPTRGGGRGGRLRAGPIDGKMAGGTIQLAMKRGDSTYEAAIRGDKRIIKTDKGWRPIADVAARTAGARAGMDDRTVAVARSLRTFKAPPAHARELLGKVVEITKTGETFTGELTEEGAGSLLPVRGGRNSRGATVSGATGKVTFWTKDGVLVKYEYTVQGTVESNGNRRSLDQTVTTSITDIGSTTLDLEPEEKLKIS